MGMMLAAPAGNDILFDDALCEQGRNFNNKIWNALRLVKGWDVSENVAQPDSAKIAISWFDARLSEAIETLDDELDKYRISEALMTVYKLFWDEFSSWYLEMIKPAYQQPIDARTYKSTLGFFEKLTLMLHPFMPFITEEVWQSVAERKPGESIMVAQMPKAENKNEKIVSDFEIIKSIVAGVRSIRLERNIPNKESLVLNVVSGEHCDSYNAVIIKMCNLESVMPADKDAAAASFMVGTAEYAVPLGGAINVEEEIKKMEEEIKYLQGFLNSVMIKLGNEKFVANAKPEVVENERKKQADAESKIKTLREGLSKLK